MYKRGRLDYGMVMRLMFVMILLATVTGLIKSYALKKNASNTTPKLAYKYFQQWLNLSRIQKSLPFVLPKKNTGFPVDGWGKSFYMRTKAMILVSAGPDERFHSSDDLHFHWISASCPEEAKRWIKQSKQRLHFRLETLPVGVSYSTSTRSLIFKDGSCKLPDLSGDDGYYNSRDDLFKSIYFLEEGSIPSIKSGRTKPKVAP